MNYKKSDREVEIDYNAFVLGMKRHMRDIPVSEKIMDNAINNTKFIERYHYDYEGFEKLGVKSMADIVLKSYVSIYKKPYKELKDMLIDMLVNVDTISYESARLYVKDYRLWTKYLESPKRYSLDSLNLQLLVFDIFVHHEHRSNELTKYTDSDIDIKFWSNDICDDDSFKF